jgi:hypothetical protein
VYLFFSLELGVDRKWSNEKRSSCVRSVGMNLLNG